MELFALFSFKIRLLLTGLVGTVDGGIIFVKVILIILLQYESVLMRVA
jgi:hypothetical protein